MYAECNTGLDCDDCPGCETMLDDGKQQTRWFPTFGYCDHCGREGKVKEELKVDENGQPIDNEAIRTLCYGCMEK